VKSSGLSVCVRGSRARARESTVQLSCVQQEIFQAHYKSSKPPLILQLFSHDQLLTLLFNPRCHLSTLFPRASYDWTLSGRHSLSSFSAYCSLRFASSLHKPPPSCGLYLRHHASDHLLTARSGIFGYVNYLVEKDRKYIIDTLVNGQSAAIIRPVPSLTCRRPRSSRIPWI